MPSLPAILAPLALLAPFGLAPADWASPDAGGALGDQTYRQSLPAKQPVSALPLSDRAPGWSPLFDPAQPANANQVRIERRVIIRISPAAAPMRQAFAPDNQRARPAPRRLVERPHGNCIESEKIAAVTTRGERLVMFLRDRRMLTAQLENGCSPRDFYQGFYMERSEDGKMCVRRDKLLSRSGARCEVARLRQLVSVSDE